MRHLLNGCSAGMMFDMADVVVGRKMEGKLAVIVLVLLLAGCMANVKSHKVPGGQGIEIDCSGLGSDWDKCYTRATRECGAGRYRVIAKSSDVKDEEGDYLFGWNPAGYVTRTMFIMCR